MMGKHRFRDMSFQTKIIAAFIIVGILPLLICFSLFYSAMKKNSIEKQITMLNRDHDQMQLQIEELMNRAEEISTMLVMDETIMEHFFSENSSLSMNEQLQKFREVTEKTQIIQESSQIDGIVYYIEDSFVMVSENGMYRSQQDYSREAWVKEIYANDGKITWGLKKEQGVFGVEEHISLGRAVWDRDDFRKVLALLAVNISRDQIMDALTVVDSSQVLWLKDSSNGNYLCSDGITEGELKDLDFGTDKEGFQKVSFGGTTYLCRESRLGESGITFGNLIPYEFVVQEAWMMGMQMWSAFLFVGLLMVALIFVLTHSLLDRMKQLTERMSAVQFGRMDRMEDNGSRDEMGQMIVSYNYMIQKLQYLLEEQYQLGLKKRETELRLIQSQINPHFLYNTLDMVSWMSVRNEKGNIQNIIRSLSRYYRLMLNKGNDIITVGQELDMCSQYMNIQMTRFSGRIQYIVEMEPCLEDMKLPKITFQPLIENAIVHGINKTPERCGEIRVEGSLENGRAVFCIRDNGRGYEIGEDTEGSSYGMKNIEERLNLYFEQEQSITVESTPGIGTCITINLPYEYKERNNEG